MHHWAFFGTFRYRALPPVAFAIVHITSIDVHNVRLACFVKVETIDGFLPGNALTYTLLSNERTPTHAARFANVCRILHSTR